MTGRTLAHYTLFEKIGEGGMGEVYRARDERLKRDVALKLLPVSFTADPERLARFEREAQVLASLHHPNVASIFGLERDGETRFLVLELIQGVDLAARLREGPLAVDEAVAVATQLATAIETAHELGIVHRDLKPANVMLTPEGRVKVLDFGLARAGEADAPDSSPHLSQSPTLTGLRTGADVILGTAAYMAPEQARGRKVDKRADIWAFGCVLFECLTGKQAFEGETVSDLIARILEREPEWEAVPKAVPPRLVDLLHRCLTKDPARRLRDIGEARILLETPGPSRVETPSGAPPPRRRGIGAFVPWLVTAVAVVLAIAAMSRRAPAPPTRWLSVVPPYGEKLDAGPEFNTLAVAPDGSSIVFVTRAAGRQHMNLRRLDGRETTVLPGTDDARDPFFSPDGDWVGFFAGRELKKISLRGGTPVKVADVAADRGGAWAENDSILFTPTFGGPLFAVSADGGALRQVTTLDSTRAERTHRWPCLLPGGEWVVFTVGTKDKPGGYDDADIEAVSLRTGERRPIARGSFARYAPGGRLVVARSGSLYSIPIDPRNPRGGATAVPVLDGVLGEETSGAVFFDIAGDGTLAYAPGAGSRAESRLAWVDLAGNRTFLPVEPDLYKKITVSPDGSRALLVVGPGGGAESDVRLLTFATGAMTRITFGGRDGSPVWMPDGRRFLWIENRDTGEDAILIRSVDGADSARVLLTIPGPNTLGAVSPDGRDLVYSRYGSVDADVERVPVSGDGPPVVEVGEPSGQTSSTISPDGRWIAYVSDETGERGIYVQPYRRPGARSQITSTGAQEPMWAPDGRSLFYISHGTVVRVALSIEGELVLAGSPRVLFEIEDSSDATYRNASLDPSGAKFLTRVVDEDSNQGREIGIVPGWAGTLGTP